MVTITDDLENENVQSGDEGVSRVAEVQVLEKAQIRDERAASDSENSEDLEPPPTLLQQRLVVESQPVVFIGESDNRSLPIALAILRGSLEGIWATSRKPLGRKWTSSKFDELLEKQITKAKANWHLKKSKVSSADRNKADQMFDAFKRYLATNRTLVMELLERFVEGADATDLQSSFAAFNAEKPTCNIWFQCPWPDIGDGIPTYRLLRSFVTSAAGIQVPGDVLIIGFTTSPEYVEGYHLNDFKYFTRHYGYELLVYNNHLIDRLLDLGYHHAGRADIHVDIIDHHVTYVFMKT